MTTQKKSARERKLTVARAVCLVVAIVMTGSILFAALVSQVF